MAFTGDKSRVTQLDPGKYRDESTGHYWAGSGWDDAVDWGTDSTFGASKSTPAAPNYSQTGTPPATTQPVVPPPSQSQPAPTPNPAPATTQTSPTTGGDWATGGWDANRVSQYFASRGVTPNSTSPTYWAQKWQEWGSKDPAYFLQRLSTADEFAGPKPTSSGNPGTSTTTGTGNKFTVKDQSGNVIGSIGTGDVTQYDPGVYKSGDGKFYTTDGQGGAIFLGNDGPAAIAWVAKHGTASGAPPTSPSGPAGPAGPPPNSSGGAPNTRDGNGNISASGPYGGVKDALYQMLLNRANQGTMIDQNDPNIRQQVDPYKAQVERQRSKYLADTAESSGPLANMQGEKRLTAAQAGQATGQFQSQLIGREIQSRRDEIQQALTQLGGQLTSDQQLALQKELGYLDDATRRYGLTNDYTLGQGQLALGQGRLGLDTGLGYGNLALGQGRLGLDTTLGLGNLALGQGRLGLDTTLGLGNLDINRNRLGLDYSDLDWRMDPRNPANLLK